MSCNILKLLEELDKEPRPVMATDDLDYMPPIALNLVENTLKKCYNG